MPLNQQKGRREKVGKSSEPAEGFVAHFLLGCLMKEKKVTVVLKL
jgi:hypothetical protein